MLNISPDQEAAFKAQAQALGLTVEQWLLNLAEQAGEAQNEEKRPVRVPPGHIAALICEDMKDVPPDVMAAMPADGASQRDHYIYGWPKKQA